MTGRATSVVAWAIGGLALAITLGSIVVWALTDAPLDSLSFPDPGLAVAFPLVGALIASRRPENSVGWVMLAMGAGAALQVGSGTYAYAAQVTFPALPGEEWAGWLQNWVWAIGFVLLANVLLVVFPDGEVPSRRWRAVVSISLVNMVFIAVTAALAPTVVSSVEGRPVPSPFPLTLPKATAELLQGVGFVAGLVLMVVCVVGLVRRFRGSTGVLRLQLTWFTYCYAVAVVALVASVVIGGSESNTFSAENVISELIVAMAVGSIAVGVGVAVLRYRLYDIGRVINRTIVYTLLTALLVGVYALIVVGIGTLTGRSNNPVVIAGATLFVAALFGPLRRRLQVAIDRRMYRRRYDAERVLGTFAALLRDEIDLGRLSAELRSTVVQAVQPSRVSVWIRDGGGAG